MRIMILLISLLLTAASTLAQPNYTGVYGGYPHCQACHASGSEPTNQYPHWRNTGHSLAYDSHPGLQWNADCLPCHTTGWDTQLSNGGFDDFFYSSDTLGMQQMRNVQCESCHGPTDQVPHPATTVVDFHAEVCADCHSWTEAPTYIEWTAGAHGSAAPIGTQQLVCAKCHEAASIAHFLDTGEPGTSLPPDPVWQVACASCHPAHADSTFSVQLWKENEDLCRSCHTMEGTVVGEIPHSPQNEMILGPGYGGFEWPGYVYNNSCHETYLPEPCTMCHMYTSEWGNPDPTATGHSLQPSISLCATQGCHDNSIPPDSSFNINNCQTETDSLMEVLGGLLAIADTTTIEYAQAKFDYNFVVNDGSRGIHNFYYARDLLMSSIEGLYPVVVNPHETNLPFSFKAEGSYPNPFNPQTAISYQLPIDSFVNLRVYDTVGRLISTRVNGWQPAGSHRATFDGSFLPSGIYIFRLTAGEFAAAGKMLLLK
jgi:predicted CXXCH cytochrome family protein